MFVLDTLFALNIFYPQVDFFNTESAFFPNDFYSRMETVCQHILFEKFFKYFSVLLGPKQN